MLYTGEAFELVVDFRSALQEKFGFERFYPGQEEVVSRVMSGQDTLAILATGAGKSLTYQLPALLLEGTTVVVSPLIALMKDQLDMLRERGITDVVALNSTLSEEQEAARARTHRERQRAHRLHDARKARRSQRFSSCCNRSTCRSSSSTKRTASRSGATISAPPISRSARVIKRLGRPTVLALTATATPAVREDILHQLGIEHVKPIVKGFDRPNLQYEARKADKEADKLKILASLFTGTQDARRHRHHLHRDDQERARSAEVPRRDAATFRPRSITRSCTKKIARSCTSAS